MKKASVLVIAILISFIGILNINAIDIQELKKGDKVCVEAPNLSKYYAYAWGAYQNADWPGIEMMQEKDSNVYCYEPAYDGYSQIIFTDSSKQTIDLHTLGSGLIYIFDENSKQDDGKYKGAWHIYDKSDLVELVNKVQSYNEEEYTYATYQNLLKALNGDNNNIGAFEVSTKNYKDDSMLIEAVEGGGYTSTYEEVYNKLLAADKALVKRQKIVVKDTIGGDIKASYKTASDTDVIITVNSNLGYRLKSLKVTEITGYDSSNNPILGTNSYEYNIDDNTNIYEYKISTSDIYVEPFFEKMTYKLSFIVGENGIIYDDADSEINSPVTVSYGDDYTLKIVANSGYDVDKVVVNGKEYELENGKLILKNITKDTDVEVSFKLKTYIVTVDDKDYKITYGTTYEELLKVIIIIKEGYTFKGLKNESGDLLSSSYVVEGAIKLTAVYEKNNEVDKNIENKDSAKVEGNPNTGDSVIKYVIILFASISVVIIAFILKRRFVKNS